MSEPRALVASTIPFSNVDGPGNRFVVFVQGCNFDCIACHNPQTIRCEPANAAERHLSRTRGDLITELRRYAPFVSGITVSGGEATRQAPFVRSLFHAVKTDPVLHRLTCFVDSNGHADADTWRSLAPVTDGVMVDLKCLDDGIHRTLTGQSNELVLRSIADLQRRGLLYEVRLLLVPGLNDDPALVARTGEWLAAVDPEMRVKVIGFRRHGVRPDPRLTRDADPDELEAHADRLRAAGLHRLCVV